jgi:nicotinic acid phosphoribosyltransferase
MHSQSDNLALLTDLYEFTMAEAYYQSEMFAPATFSLFIRDYPPNRGYFVSAGLAEVLDYLTSISYSQNDLDYLKSTGHFSDEFLHYLGSLQFSGDVHAMPEGRLFFKDEPVLEVSAPIIEGQLMESQVINAVNLQVNLASKAARCVHAARGRKIVDFSLRRAQGTDAGLKAARAGYIAGLSATSNVLAGKMYAMPVAGTMAHSFITSFKEEIDAFGVGTKMGTSADSPYTDMAYKLVQYDGRPVLKLSSGKKTLVAQKQVFRFKDSGRFVKDMIALRDEDIDAEPLLQPVMKNGKRLQAPESLDTMRERFQRDFEALGDAVKAIENPARFPVEVAAGLEALQKDIVHEVIEKELGES